MDERLEEVRAITRIWPIRKLTLVRPKKGRRELTYQFNQFRKDKKLEKTNLVLKEILEVSNSDSSSVPNSNDYVEDLKKRVAFDRALIIGD